VAGGSGRKQVSFELLVNHKTGLQFCLFTCSGKDFFDRFSADEMNVHAPSASTTATVATVCAPCHGLDGIGMMSRFKNIAGQQSIYLRKQLMAFKSGKREHLEMKYIAQDLTERGSRHVRCPLLRACDADHKKCDSPLISCFH
jgi:cytochrome c553